MCTHVHVIVIYLTVIVVHETRPSEVGRLGRLELPHFFLDGDLCTWYYSAYNYSHAHCLLSQHNRDIELRTTA